MANIFDVAKYILSETGEMSTMKLQKLCYYCQAWHLVWKGIPLFKNDFQAWANGPVCDELFKIHKGKFTISDNDINEKLLENNLSEENISLINVVKEFYGKYTGAWLSELSHKELPWKKTREDNHASVGKRCKAVIDKKLIQDYYSSLQNV